MEQNSPASTLVSLISDCAEAQVLDKAVFSKCRDKMVSRATLTLKRVKGEVILQLETLRTADAADTEVNRKKPVQAAHENLTTANAMDIMMRKRLPDKYDLIRGCDRE